MPPSFPLFHFSPSLYNHVVNELKKPIILVLNKADIVDKHIVDQWVTYLMEKFPSLKIVCFSSFRPISEGDILLFFFSLPPFHERKRKEQRKEK
jgi:ribosome biogenesis GTPase A